MAQAKDAELGDMTEEEAAAAMGIRVSTLRKERYRNPDHPPYRKVGARVTYPRVLFSEWNDRHIVRPRAPEAEQAP